MPRLPTTPPSIGRTEQIVLEFLWTRGEATAEECRLGLAARLPVKESTMRTVLTRLEAKGFVRHVRRGKAFVYRAATARQNLAVRAARAVIDRFCNGSAEELVSGLVQADVIDAARLERIARRIARARQEES